MSRIYLYPNMYDAESVEHHKTDVLHAVNESLKCRPSLNTYR